ncbi:hypothetical protein GTQ40_02905 [Flavobacteriaceae bacterium R38]|nr:hypothetical protein [Flavobacteriaceae bacterium R38]
MKKIVQILLLISSINLYAQKIGTVPLKDIEVPYMKINISPRGSILKPYQNKIFVDFGQISKQSKVRNGFIYDDNGNEKTFNGIVDALNFFHQYGWELDNAFPLGCCDPTAVSYFHYILKKRKVKL